MNNLIQPIIDFIQRKLVRDKRYRWNHQYQSGMWDGLRNLEMKRLETAKALLELNGEQKRLLEIGCGEGVFYKQMGEEMYQFYEGTDISDVAIAAIEPSEKSAFYAGDMESYEPKHAPFSTIIFNEVLYYSKQPMHLLKRYEAYLEENGQFLIGMYDSGKSAGIWAEIDTTYIVVQHKVIEDQGKRWDYKLIGRKSQLEKIL